MTSEYAFYSYEQEHVGKNRIPAGNRYFIYEKRDGSKVKTTEIVATPNSDHKLRFRDSVFVGEVVKWVETVRWETG